MSKTELEERGARFKYVDANASENMLKLIFRSDDNKCGKDRFQAAQLVSISRETMIIPFFTMLL